MLKCKMKILCFLRDSETKIRLHGLQTLLRYVYLDLKDSIPSIPCFSTLRESLVKAIEIKRGGFDFLQ